MSITINNYTLVDSLEIEFSGGTTAITGETGAGKSLILDALSMALGDRADSSTIRHGKDRAQITTSFDISCISEAKKWLEHNDFSEGDECILRRIYTTEGRSKGYINGQPCTMQQLQQLGDILVDLHSQHEHLYSVGILIANYWTNLIIALSLLSKWLVIFKTGIAQQRNYII